MLLCLLQSCGTLEWKSHWQWKQGSLGTCPWGARVQVCVQAPSREILVTWSGTFWCGYLLVCSKCGSHSVSEFLTKGIAPCIVIHLEVGGKFRNLLCHQLWRPPCWFTSSLGTSQVQPETDPRHRWQRETEERGKPVQIGRWQI